MRSLLLPLAAAAALLAGCSAGQDIELAQGEVVRFHQMLDAGRFAEIYAGTGAEIRRDMSGPEFIAFLTAVHNGLGNVTKADSIGFNVNYDSSGNTVTLTYDTQFARGSRQETFVYTLAGNKATLSGYEINQKAGL